MLYLCVFLCMRVFPLEGWNMQLCIQQKWYFFGRDHHDSSSVGIVYLPFFYLSRAQIDHDHTKNQNHTPIPKVLNTTSLAVWTPTPSRHQQIYLLWLSLELLLLFWSFHYFTDYILFSFQFSRRNSRAASSVPRTSNRSKHEATTLPSSLLQTSGALIHTDLQWLSRHSKIHVSAK